MPRLSPRRAIPLLEQVAVLARTGASLEQGLPGLARAHRREGGAALLAMKGVLLDEPDKERDAGILDEHLGPGSAHLLASAARRGRLAQGLTLLSRLEARRAELRRRLVRPLLQALPALALLALLPTQARGPAGRLLCLCLLAAGLWAWLRRAAGPAAARLRDASLALAWQLAPSLTRRPARARFFWLLAEGLEEGLLPAELVDSTIVALAPGPARQRARQALAELQRGSSLALALERSGWLSASERPQLETACEVARPAALLAALAEQDLQGGSRASQRLAVALLVIPYGVVIIAWFAVVLIMLRAELGY